MEKRFKKTIDNFINYSKGRNYKVFAVFILISTFFWVLIKFSIQYTMLGSYPVEYVNVPKNLAWGEIEEQNIEISITASGFRHLNHLILGKKVEIDLSKLRKGNKDQYFILPKGQMPFINEQFLGVSILTYQNPDTLYFDFSKKVNKKVPVLLNDSITLAKSFQYKSPVRVKPDSIVLSGPESRVEKIKYVETIKFVKLDVSGNSKTQLYLKSLNDSKIDVSNNFVDVILEVEKFTQNSIKIPVKVLNVPEGYILKTFPDNVNIVFNTGLSDFKSISESSFNVIVDYLKASSTKGTSIPVEINVNSDKVDIINIEPKEVEFLLRKI